MSEEFNFRNKTDLRGIAVLMMVILFGGGFVYFVVRTPVDPSSMLDGSMLVNQFLPIIIGTIIGIFAWFGIRQGLPAGNGNGGLQAQSLSQNGEWARQNTLRQLDAQIDFLQLQLERYNAEIKTFGTFPDSEFKEKAISLVGQRIQQTQKQLQQKESYKQDVMSRATWDN